MVDVSRPACESAAHCSLAPTRAEWEDLHRYTETLRTLNDRLRGAYEQLSSLLSLGQAMNAAGSRERVGEILLEITREVLPYKSAALLLYEEENYRRLNAVNMSDALDEELAHQCENGVLQWVREESHPTALAASPGDNGPTSYAFVPLLFQEEFVGVLWIAMDVPVESLTQDKLQIADVLAGQAAAAFRNAAYLDLERSYQQLHALESIKNDLTHMIIHDLRSPLTIIMGNIENALALATHPKQKEILSRGINGCEGLLTLINNLLDVSRMEEGKLQLHREPMRIQDVVQANLEILNPAAARMHKQIVCSIAQTVPEIHADRDLISRVIANLLGNALKYAPAGDPIEVEAEWLEESAQLQVSVTDHGQGISPEYHEKIFQKFGQVEAKQSHERVGSGLGLTFCRMVVEAHGGRIWVESEMGEYTRFLFVLPDMPAEAAE